MIINQIKSDKKNHLVILGSTAAIMLLLTSIITVGVAQSSYAQEQQQSQQLKISRGFITSWMIADNTIVSADLRDGAAVRSEDIVDGQVSNEDLADDAVTSDKITDGEVKAEDLDPSIQIGDDETPAFSFQVTERSNSIIMPQEGVSVSVQCNSDEIVTGGGFGWDANPAQIRESKKLDNGWTATWSSMTSGAIGIVYAECLKIVEEGTTTG